MGIIDDRIPQRVHGMPQALCTPAQCDPGIEDGLRLGAQRLPHRGFELVRHWEVAQVVHERGEQPAKLPDHPQRGLSGEFLLDRDGGGDVLTSRAKEVI